MINDTEYRELIITKVSHEDGGWFITTDDGWSFWVPGKHGVEPHVGEAARFYGRGIGSVVRGLFIHGRQVFYRTPDEQAEEGRLLVEHHNAGRRASFKQKQSKLDADYASLPLVFQQRLDRFRASGSDWRWNHEPYEMSCCVDAVKIATSCTTPDGVAIFHKLPWVQQKEQIPDLFDGHSGNSFGVACLLARVYLEQPGLVVWQHGALCGLVGCEEYGDVRPTKEQVDLAMAGVR